MVNGPFSQNLWSNRLIKLSCGYEIELDAERDREIESFVCKFSRLVVGIVI